MREPVPGWVLSSSISFAVRAKRNARDHDHRDPQHNQREPGHVAESASWPRMFRLPDRRCGEDEKEIEPLDQEAERYDSMDVRTQARKVRSLAA